MLDMRCVTLDLSCRRRRHLSDLGNNVVGNGEAELNREPTVQECDATMFNSVPKPVT